ncbi:MAG: 3-oxoacyl-ACP reductase FabG [Clostridia bacterium]|nr:3-oxoacyl-ACP reductase FabG [Clostridia bacterium]
MRNVLITGGSRGIGAACVRKFAAAGDRVIFLYRSSEEAAAKLAHETGAMGLKCDVADKKAVEALFSQFSVSVDVLINNAGIAGFSLFQDLSEEDWSRMMETHLGGTFRCTKGVLPAMIAKQKGCIINLSSMWGQVGASCEVAYSAAKAGIIGLTKALAKEVGPSGIRVNCVAPGVIETDMNAALTPETVAALAEETPLGRIGTPEEIAETVFWLASDNASFLTGQVIAPNGGLVI